MKTPLKRRLDQLAEYLNDGSSVVPGALERLRNERDNTTVSTASGRIRRYRNRIAVLTAAAALVALAFTWMKPAGFGTSLAFADVQEAIRQVETAVLTIECRERPDMSCRQLMRCDSSVLRVEYRSGHTWLLDAAGHKLLILNKHNHTAQLSDIGSGAEDLVPSYLDRLLDVEQEVTRPLGERTIGDRTLVGFSLPSRLLLMQGLEGTVWVDPRTRLPVRAEAVRNDGRTIPLHMTVEFRFNTFLAPSLVLLSPPDGYELGDYRDLSALQLPPLAPSDPNATTEFLIEPGVGIGDVRFGMTKEQVVEALGLPDKIWDFPESGRVMLAYRPRGLEMTIQEDDGVVEFECSAECFNPGSRPFAGHTAKGIGIGSTRDTVLAAYGQPDQGHADSFRIRYDSLEMAFGIHQDCVCWIELYKRPVKQRPPTDGTDDESTPRSQPYWEKADTVAPEWHPPSEHETHKESTTPAAGRESDSRSRQPPEVQGETKWRIPSKHELQKKPTTPQAGKESDESRPRVHLAPAASGYQFPPDSHSAPKVTFASPSATNGVKPRSPDSGTPSDRPEKPVVDGGH